MTGFDSKRDMAADKLQEPVREALKLALEALEGLNNTNSYWWQEVDEQTIKKIEPAITTIKKALAQPAQEPVGEAHLMQEGFTHCIWSEGVVPVDTKLYTAPPQREWVGLTQKEVQEIHDTYHKRMGPQEFASMIGAKLKEKNT
jgi:hypothetical protein